jgi:hypothetical protein
VRAAGIKEEAAARYAARSVGEASGIAGAVGEGWPGLAEGSARGCRGVSEGQGRGLASWRGRATRGEKARVPFVNASAPLCQAPGYSGAINPR